MATLSQQEIALRATIAKTLYIISGVNPSATYDRNMRAIVGQRWINKNTREEFVCLSNEPNAAVWTSTTSGGGGGGGGVAPHVAAIDPTSTDDTGDGYVVGQVWVNSVTHDVFIAASVATGAAVWIDVSTTAVVPHTTTTAPIATSDAAHGFTLGQLWINTTDNTVYVAANVTNGAAIWVQVGGSGTVTAASVTATADSYLSGTTVQAQLTDISNKMKATIGLVRSIGVFGVGYGGIAAVSYKTISGYYTVAY